MFHFLLWYAMAGRARRGGLASVGSLEVTEETDLFRHCDMLALNNLGMTARAAQPMAPLQFADMHVVIEKNVFLEDYFAIVKPLGMTALLQTDRIVYFRPWSRIISVSKILQDIG
jgi:hypothetical protein